MEPRDQCCLQSTPIVLVCEAYAIFFMSQSTSKLPLRTTSFTSKMSDPTAEAYIHFTKLSAAVTLRECRNSSQADC
jgi:hypothetical protein